MTLFSEQKETDTRTTQSVLAVWLGLNMSGRASATRHDATVVDTNLGGHEVGADDDDGTGTGKRKKQPSPSYSSKGTTVIDRRRLSRLARPLGSYYFKTFCCRMSSSRIEVQSGSVMNPQGLVICHKK